MSSASSMAWAHVDASCKHDHSDNKQSAQKFHNSGYSFEFFLNVVQAPLQPFWTREKHAKHYDFASNATFLFTAATDAASS